MIMRKKYFVSERKRKKKQNKMIPRRRTYFSLPPWQECTGNDERGCAL